MPSLYERYLLPCLLDCACGLPALQAQRARLVPQARGRVLEIGIGTGLNLPHYDPARVQAIVGLDPGHEMHPLARRRSEGRGLPLELVAQTAEAIPFEDAAFDTVLVTFSLCTIPDPVTALREMRRVLKPGGQLLFCEHGAAPEAGVRAWQRRLTPWWRRIAGGCHLDRDIPALLAEGGFATRTLESAYLPGPRPWTYVHRGAATPA